MLAALTDFAKAITEHLHSPTYWAVQLFLCMLSYRFAVVPRMVVAALGTSVALIATSRTAGYTITSWDLAAAAIAGILAYQVLYAFFYLLFDR